MYSTPFSLHTGTSSATSMGLEASEIWVSPWQKASKPSLVPAPPTSMRASGFSCRKSSAAAWVIGCTVLEPSMLMLPETAPPPWPPALLPHEARNNDNPNRSNRPTSHLGRAIPLNPYTPSCRTAVATQSISLGTIIGHRHRGLVPAV